MNFQPRKHIWVVWTHPRKAACFVTREGAREFIKFYAIDAEPVKYLPTNSKIRPNKLSIYYYPESDSASPVLEKQEARIHYYPAFAVKSEG